MLPDRPFPDISEHRCTIELLALVADIGDDIFWRRLQHGLRLQLFEACSDPVETLAIGFLCRGWSRSFAISGFRTLAVEPGAELALTTIEGILTRRDNRIVRVGRGRLRRIVTGHVAGSNCLLN